MSEMKETVVTELPSEVPTEVIENKVHGCTGVIADTETDQRNNNNVQDAGSHKNIDELGKELDNDDTSLLDGNGRDQLFQKGLLYEQDNQQELALKCYLGCLKGLKQDSNFSLLPQCLRNVADIYYKKEDYQRAVHFIQAEKLFYENALIDITELGKAEIDIGEENGSVDQPTMEKVRAEEYEQLARLCLERKQPHLALEYAGKATKIRQSVYGSNDPCTQESLDFFANIYAEVGKQQYSDSMGKISIEREKETDSDDNTPDGDKGKQTGETTPSSILRNRKHKNRPRSAQHVRFVDDDETRGNTQTDERQQQELAVSNHLLIALFVVCTILLSLLGAFLYCRLFMESSQGCIVIKSYVHYFLMKIKYYYYYFSSSKLLKYV